MLENEEGINKSDELSKKLELKHLLQEQVKNALIRSSFCSVKDMDAPSAYFFKLERNVVQHNPMLHLRRPDGTITHNPNEMRKLILVFSMLSNVMMRVLRTFVKISLSCNQNRDKLWTVTLLYKSSQMQLNNFHRDVRLVLME